MAGKVRKDGVDGDDGRGLREFPCDGFYFVCSRKQHFQLGFRGGRVGGLNGLKKVVIIAMVSGEGS